MRILVTGGAGFIGSHLVELLIDKKDHDVTVFDDFSKGRIENLRKVIDSPRLRVVKGNIRDREQVFDVVKDKDFVFHLCDNTDIRSAASHTSDYIDQNILGAFHVLEAMREFGVKKIAFPSSTTVFGDATTVPTPENYGPLQPMNIYGAAKLACEALLSSYAYTFDFITYVFRLVDIVGGRMDHGVIFDFVRKLLKNPDELEILGDGSQRRTFLLVEECVQAMWHAITNLNQPVNLVHIGNGNQISITQVGEIVRETMGLSGAAFRYTGGKRGWRGDAFSNHIESGTLTRLGWKPARDSAGTVGEAAKRIYQQLTTELGIEKRK